MKITVEFHSLEEFMQYMKTGEGFTEPVEKEKEAAGAFAEACQRIQKLQEEAEAEAAKDLPMNPPEPAEKPVDTGTGTIVGATPEEQRQIEAEEKPMPAYTLTDAQKAVREVVKKKGKDVAKEILARFQHKDKEGPATGASALKPEDYAEAIKALEEALNG